MTTGLIIGHSPALTKVLQQVESVAGTESTVLIQGETGTGKELVARAVHLASARGAGPFVKLNATAIPAGLLESELFGHERGAFTGAVSRRLGRFEIATDGTLFLDEIGEMDPVVQPKILRVLQEREFERLGSSRTLSSNARLVAATNRNLLEMVEDGLFREDLYYRLSVFPIRIPPLRERREDIPALVNHFLVQLAARMQKPVPAVSPGTMARLQQHDWPGNVRELQNVIERAMILARSAIVQFELPEPRAIPGESRRRPVAPDALADAERAHIMNVLRKSNWVVAGPNGAAARLGVKRTTLNFRMKRLGIRREPSHPFAASR